MDPLKAVSIGGTVLGAIGALMTGSANSIIGWKKDDSAGWKEVSSNFKYIADVFKGKK